MNLHFTCFLSLMSFITYEYRSPLIFSDSHDKKEEIKMNHTQVSGNIARKAMISQFAKKFREAERQHDQMYGRTHHFQQQPQLQQEQQPQQRDLPLQEEHRHDMQNVRRTREMSGSSHHGPRSGQRVEPINLGNQNWHTLHQQQMQLQLRQQPLQRDQIQEDWNTRQAQQQQQPQLQQWHLHLQIGQSQENWNMWQAQQQQLQLQQLHVQMQQHQQPCLQNEGQDRMENCSGQFGHNSGQFGLNSGPYRHVFGPNGHSFGQDEHQTNLPMPMPVPMPMPYSRYPGNQLARHLVQHQQLEPDQRGQHEQGHPHQQGVPNYCPNNSRHCSNNGTNYNQQHDLAATPYLQQGQPSQQYCPPPTINSVNNAENHPHQQIHATNHQNHHYLNRDGYYRWFHNLTFPDTDSNLTNHVNRDQYYRWYHNSLFPDDDSHQPHSNDRDEL